jgi:hypothetical protein
MTRREATLSASQVNSSQSIEQPQQGYDEAITRFRFGDHPSSAAGDTFRSAGPTKIDRHQC